MAVKAGSAFIELSIRGGGGLKKSLAGIGSQMKGLVGSASSLKTTLVAALGGGSVAGAATIALKKFVELGDAMDKMSARTGVSAESLSQLKFAAEQSGQSAEQLEAVLIGMARQTRNLEMGLTTAKEAFAALGLSYKDIEGKAPEEQFLTMAEALSKIEDPTKRAGLAMQVFGRAGRNLIPLLSQGEEGIRKMMEEADALGATISKDTATKAAALADTWNRLKTLMTGVLVDVGAKIAPFAQSFIESALEIGLSWKTVFLEIEIAIRTHINKAQQMWDKYSDYVGDLTMGLLHAFAKLGNNESFIEATRHGVSGGRNQRGGRASRDAAFEAKRSELSAQRDAAAKEAAAALAKSMARYGADSVRPAPLPFELPEGLGTALQEGQDKAARAAALSTGGFAGTLSKQAGKVDKQIRLAEQQLAVEEKTLAALEKLTLSFG